MTALNEPRSTPGAPGAHGRVGLPGSGRGVVVYRVRRRPDGAIDDLVTAWSSASASGNGSTFELFRPLGRTQDRELIGSVVETGLPAELRIAVEGGGHEYLVTLVPVLDTLVCAYEDLTANQSAEDERRVAERRIQQSLDNLNAAFLRVDHDLVVIEITRGGAALFGATPDDLLGHDLVALADGLDTSDLVELVMRAVATQRSQRADLHLRPEPSPIFDVEAVPEADDGAVTEVLVSAHDVTEARLAASRLAEVQRLESLGQLARGLAHDFNNLLQAILGHADLLAADSPDGRQRTSAQAIVRAAGRASALVGQLQAYAGQRPVARELIELRSLARESANLARSGFPDDVELVVERGREVWVEADPAQLHQVVLNLLINAADALADGPGTVRLSVQAARPEPGTHWMGRAPDLGADTALLSVSDDGPGMNEEVRRHLFEPFFSTRGVGRGLGMAIVLGMVQAHGGAIAVDTVVGRGTTIVVALPLGHHPSADREGSSLTADDAHPGVRILVVDDDDLVRETACLMLERLGYAPTGVSGGKEAVAAWRNEGPYDLVLCDLAMRDMDGRATWDALDKLSPGLPVVLVSGHAAAELDAMTLPDGRPPAGTLSKPFGASELSGAIEAALAGEAE